MNNISIKVESGGAYGGNLARISINDIEIGYANYSRGINVAAIEPERGQPLIATTFDTLVAESSEVLIQFIEQLPAGVLVALAVKEEANYSFSDAAKKACEALGSIKVHQLPTVGSWAMIGKKGDAPGSATEEVSYGPAIQTHTLSVAEAAPSLGVICVTSGGGDRAYRTQITLNGAPVSVEAGCQRGLNVAVFDERQGTVLIGGTFDLLANPSSADAFAHLIESLPDGRIVAIAACDEASFYLSEAAKKACEAIGSRLIRQLAFRGEWAIVGRKGAVGGVTVENLSNYGVYWGGEPVTVKFWIPPAVPASPAVRAHKILASPAVPVEEIQASPVPVEETLASPAVPVEEIQASPAVPAEEIQAPPPVPIDEIQAPPAAAVEEIPASPAAPAEEIQAPPAAAVEEIPASPVMPAEEILVAPASPAVPIEEILASPAAPAEEIQASPVAVEDLLASPAVPAEEILVAPAVPAPPVEEILASPAVPAGEIQASPAVPAEEIQASPAVPAEEIQASPPVPAEENPIAGAPKEIALAHKLQPADLKGNSKFSHSVAISGGWAIAGASWASARSKDCAGAAYIFQHSNGAWEEKQKLQPAQLQGGDWFGSSVAISGEWAIVGASCAGAPGSKRAGAAYIFQYESGSWQQKQKLQPADLQRNDFFGSTVAISDGWAIVGASDADAPGKENVGAAYIFQCSNGVWEEKQKLQPAQLQRGDCFGSAVAISGGWAIVGAIYTDAAGFDSAGAAYIFECESGVWQQKHKLKAAELQTDEEFGISVAMSGDWAIVGASGAGVPGQEKAGAAYIFHCESGLWLQKQKLQPADLQGGERFGYSVSVGDGWAIVGVERAGAAGKQNAGAAYIFQCENGVWQQKRKLQPEELQPDDRFGCAVAISGSRAVVGAGYARTSGKSRAGAAYVFEGEVLSGESGS